MNLPKTTKNLIYLFVFLVLSFSVGLLAATIFDQISFVKAPSTLKMTSILNMQGNAIQNVQDPVNLLDLATKAYVDAAKPCVTCNLPACPFEGTPGDVWVTNSRFADDCQEAPPRRAAGCKMGDVEPWELRCRIGEDCYHCCFTGAIPGPGGFGPLVNTYQYLQTIGENGIRCYSWSGTTGTGPAICELCVVK